MERYEKYKDSGVEWIGEIPDRWGVRPLTKYLENIADYRGRTPKKLDTGMFLVTARNIKNGHIDYSLSKEYVDPDEAQSLLGRGAPKIGDVLFTTEAPLGEVANIDREDIALAQRVIKFRGKKEHLSNYFLKYFLMSDPFQQDLHTYATGSTALGIKASRLPSLLILTPPISEQTAIANYLDRKTAEIDELIAQKEHLIELYEEEKTAIINQAITKGIDPNAKLKDSGIDWLGEIPEEWEIRKLKYLGNIKYGLGQPPKLKTDGLPLIRATNVFRGKIDDKDMIYVDPDDIPYDRDPILKENDIIIVRSGAYTADSAIIPKSYEGAVAGYDMVFRASQSSNPQFISYCLLSNYVLNIQLLLHSIRAAQPHLNREELGETLIIHPQKIEEQTAIVQHIETETARIDAQIAKAKKIIELQKEYRTALISEVVTGKVKVSHLASQEVTA